MTPFLTVPFRFSDPAIAWLDQFTGPIVQDYQENAPAISALISLDPAQVQEITNSIVWTELVDFFKKIDPRIEPYPQLFIYKRLENPRRVVLGNPHIDTHGPGGLDSTTHVRFNILLNGDEDTEMVWWPHDRSSSAVATIEFERPDKTKIGRLQACGTGLANQWALLGKPTWRARFLARRQEYASFVRTDILHALNWTGDQPRLIFSLRCNGITWADLDQVLL